MGGRRGDGSAPHCRLPTDVTLLLVGKVGSGKSATGNSILGWDAFESEPSWTSVTQTSQVNRTTLFDGSSEARAINVIDTPGLFEMNTAIEDAHKEFAKCMDLSKDGVHAILMVFSAHSRFTHEDVDTVEAIKMFFGDSIADHMILVFTHGDQIEESTLKAMLSDTKAGYLQELVMLCGHRVVLFDNRTRDAAHKQEQLKKLLHAVDSVISENDGMPFSNQMFNQIKEMHERPKEIEGEMSKSNKDIYDAYLMLVTKMVEERLNSAIVKIKNQLLEEQNARQRLEKEVAEEKLRTEEEIRELRERLKKARQDTDKARQDSDKAQRLYEKFSWIDEKCTIM